MAPTRRRQGAAAGGAAAAQPSSAPAPPGEPSALQRANFYFAQHVGLVCCVLGIGVIWAGYDAGWMHNTHLCLLGMGLCLLGLFFHELRPFNAQNVYEEDLKAAKAAAEVAR